MSHPSFFDITIKNMRRLLRHWTPVTVSGAFIGLALSFIGLFNYTTSIGRIDLFMAATEARPALAIWLFSILLLLFLYLSFFVGSSMLYGITVSMFDKVPDRYPVIARWFLIPTTSGFGLFLLSVFHKPEWLSEGWAVIGVCLVVVILSALLCAFKSVRKIIKDNTSSSSATERGVFLFFLLILTIGIVLASTFPTFFILKTYIGEDNPEALNFLACLSMITFFFTLAPTFIFYQAKGSTSKRIFYTLTTVLILYILFLIISPGTFSSSVYTAAGQLGIRENQLNRFTLDDGTLLSDLDGLQWRTHLNKQGRTEVVGWPLFSFGDTLLLCPASLLSRSIHVMRRYTLFCIHTQHSKVQRKPRRAYAEFPVHPVTWQSVGARYLKVSHVNIPLPPAPACNAANGSTPCPPR